MSEEVSAMKVNLSTILEAAGVLTVAGAALATDVRLFVALVGVALVAVSLSIEGRS